MIDIELLVSVNNINLYRGENNIVLINTSALKNGTFQVVVNARNNSSTVKMFDQQVTSTAIIVQFHKFAGSETGIYGIHRQG